MQYVLPLQEGKNKTGRRKIRTDSVPSM